jgi:Uri superfamily endonuclease
MNLQSNNPGIYTLILRRDDSQKIRIGSLGVLEFAAGFYAYTGSARGPGGLKRVDRHILVLEGKKNTRRWHIDYLLPGSGFQEVVITRTAQDLECQIARSIGETLQAVPKFGCSDCDCQSHLHYSDDLQRLLDSVRKAHSRAKSDAIQISSKRR